MATDNPLPADGDSAVAVKKSPMLMIVLPMLVLGLAGGGWIGFSQYAKLAHAAAIIGQDFGTEEKPDQAKPLEYGEFTELTGLIINPSDSEGRRYLMVNVGLEATDSGVIESLTDRQIVVRDTILRQLSQHTVAELADITQRTVIKQELIDALNGVLDKGGIQRLYFTQYVLQ